MARRHFLSKVAQRKRASEDRKEHTFRLCSVKVNFQVQIVASQLTKRCNYKKFLVTMYSGTPRGLAAASGLDI